MDVAGKMVGSTNIDRSLHEFLTSRLEVISRHLPRTPSQIAWETMSDVFERVKCNFDPRKAQAPTIPFVIPGLREESSFPEVGIQNGRLSISM